MAENHATNKSEKEKVSGANLATASPTHVNYVVLWERLKLLAWMPMSNRQGTPSENDYDGTFLHHYVV